MINIYYTENICAYMMQIEIYQNETFGLKKSNKTILQKKDDMVWLLGRQPFDIDKKNL